MTESQALDPEILPTQQSEADGEATKKGGFPSPLTILLLVLVGVWILGLVLPSGQYELNDAGAPIPGSFHEVPSPLDFRDSLSDLALSPGNGLFGVQDPTTGNVGPFNSGSLFGSAHVFLFILAIGGFMTVVFRTGALDNGIAHLAHKFSTRGPVLIIVLSILFGILGSVMSWSDETLGFYALMIPLFIGLGYDRMTTVAVVTVAPFAGAIGATVNPFRIGTGSDAAGVSMGDGLVLRVVLLVLVLAVTIWWTLRYAKKVKDDPSASLVPNTAEDLAMVEASGSDALEPLSGTHKAIIGFVAGIFVLMIFSVVPLAVQKGLGDISWMERITLYWYFPELAAMFLVAAIIIGLIGKLGEEGMVTAIIAGMGDFIGAAFIIAFARGVTVVMNNAGITDTVLSSLEGIVTGMTGAVFAVMMFIVNIPLAFLVPSSSGHATLAMPIMAPLGDFAGVSRAIVVTAYQSASGWVNLFTPTSAIVMGGLAIAKVRYDRYLKWVWPLLVILFVLTCVLLALGVAVPALGGN